MARPDGPLIGELAAEWRRVELLASCMLGARRGEEPPEHVLEELAELAGTVAERRAAGAWETVGGEGLTDLELDVLAATLAAAIFGRTAALLAAVEGRPTAEFRPSLALIGELLTLTEPELPGLAATMARDGQLRRRGLVAQAGADGHWHAGLLTGTGLVETLLEVPDAIPAPPGSIPVPVDGATVADLVVAPSVIARLDEFVRAVEHRGRVHDWGLGRRSGPIAMFSGPSGVGKSLAARAVAGQLGYPLFKVDLGALVSKYIGETEKNLSLLFDAAEGRDLLLHFEEAESIFGRRGEIREARDRYANLEVSHLLSRLEAHDGPCILSTNLRRNVDPAFLRRFTSVVEFARPALDDRIELWRRSLPQETVEAGAVRLDEVAKVDITGGQIRNAATYACLVAERPDAASVTEAEVTLGIWREMTKSGHRVKVRDLPEPLRVHLRPEHHDGEGGA